MVKKYFKIFKDYFSLVDFKEKNLFLFIIFDLLVMIVLLIIPFYESSLIENISNRLFSKSISNLIFLSLLFIFYDFFLYFDYYTYACFFKNTYASIHKKIMKSIYNFDENYNKTFNRGKLISSSNMDIIKISEIPSFLFSSIMIVIKIIVIYYMFFKVNIFMGIYVIIINYLYLHYSNYCNEKRAFYFNRQIKYADKLISLLSQVLTGLKDIKSFNISDKIENKFDVYRKKWQVNYFETRRYLFTKESIVVGIVQFGKVSIYLILIMFFFKDKISLAMLFLLLKYYENSIDSVMNLVSNIMSINEESVSMYRILDVVNYKKDKKSNEKIYEDKILGKLELKNVSFSYKNELILKNVSFVVEPNIITTIVGENGTGKSTIFNLLLRFYKPSKGKILMDDLDIYDYSKDIYYKNITVVNQKTFIFNMSIRENLSLVDSNKERQINACKRVGIHDFIASLPDGYNTVLKEDATNISGGQKQLLSLARALLTTSEILLLDEITSALDPKITSHIIDLLDDLKQDHTLLLITHNKDIMKNSDKIVVLKDGKIVGVGNHKELIKNNINYKALQNLDY